VGVFGLIVLFGLGCCMVFLGLGCVGLVFCEVGCFCLDWI